MTECLPSVRTWPGPQITTVCCAVAQTVSRRRAGPPSDASVTVTREPTRLVEVGRLLRSWATDSDPERVEVLFQYVQRLDTPMTFEGLVIDDATGEDGDDEPWATLRVQFPECRVYRLMSGGSIVGRVLAAACAHGTDTEPADAPSMFTAM